MKIFRKIKFLLGTIIIILPLCLFSQQEKDKPATPIYHVGLGFEPHLSFANGMLRQSSGDMIIVAPMPISSQSLGVGFVLSADVIFQKKICAPLIDSLLWGFASRLSFSGESLSGTVEEPSRSVLVNGVLSPLREQNRIEWNLSCLTLTTSISANKLIPKWDSARVMVSLGPIISLNLGQKLNQFTDILSPDSYNYVETGNKSRLLSQGKIDDVNNIRFRAELMVGAKWDARRVFKKLQYPVFFGGELGYRGYFTSVISNSDILLSGVVMRVLLDYQL